MGKSSPTPPAAPDPVKTASAQTGSNIQTAIANSIMGNADQYGPNGSTTYQQIGTQTITGDDGKTYQVPKYSQTTALSPEQQGLYDQQVGLSSGLNSLAGSQVSRLSDVLGSPVNLSGLPQGGTLPTSAPGLSTVGAGGQIQNGIADAGKIQSSVGPVDYSADRQRVENALYSRLNPQLDRDRAALETRLVNQGFQRGSEAFNQEMDAANRQANDQRAQVVLAGGQEQSRLADLALQSGNFANAAQAQQYTQNANNAGFSNQAQQQGFDQAQSVAGFNNNVGLQGFTSQMDLAQARDTQRERALQESLVPRTQAINEVASLMNGGQVSTPQFTPYQPGKVAGTDIGGMVYQTAALNNQNYQTQVSQQNSLLGGLMGLGAAGIFKYSDERLKDDIKKVGETDDGIGLYSYRYKGDDKKQIGLIAQDVEKKMPNAVKKTKAGFKAVNYSKALGLMDAA